MSEMIGVRRHSAAEGVPGLMTVSSTLGIRPGAILSDGLTRYAVSSITSGTTFTVRRLTVFERLLWAMRDLLSSAREMLDGMSA